jgi:hypothetical protein
MTDVQASNIWSQLNATSGDLTQYEADALFSLIEAKPAVRAAFLRQLSEVPSHVIKFAYRADAVIRAFRPPLTAPENRAVLERVVAAAGSTTDGGQLLTLALAAQALDPPLTARETRAVLARVLAVIGSTTDRQELVALAQAVQILGRNPQLASAAFGPLRDKVTQTGLREARVVLAEAVVAVLAAEPDYRFADGIVNVLKHPNVTGKAMRVLLDALNKRFAEAPGTETGYTANLAWARARFPGVGD